MKSEEIEAQKPSNISSNGFNKWYDCFLNVIIDWLSFLSTIGIDKMFLFIGRNKITCFPFTVGLLS